MVEKNELNEYILKEKELVERIAKALREIYGHTWNFEIDFVEGEVHKNFILRIKAYKR